MSAANYKPRDWASQPPQVAAGYKSTSLRGPRQAPLPLPQSLSELSGPVFGPEAVGPLDHDLTRSAARNGQPIGERIVFAGQVIDEDGRPQPNALIEIWQTNAAGRYVHIEDRHDAPLDPNFLGAGRCVSDAGGRYRFLTVKPGAYPWGNHANAWRPAHIHFSLFGHSLATRLVTQVYFPGDPLLPLDPVFMSVPEAARERLVARFSLDDTEPGFALGYRFDFVLRGRHETPVEG